MAKKTKKQDKIDGARITRIYGQYCRNIQIPIMSIPKIHDAGMKLLDEGAEDQAIGEAMFAIVQTVRVN